MQSSFVHRKASQQTIINPDWNFNKMGIGGLDNEFSAIFRRAFASRVFPPEVVQQLGELCHEKTDLKVIPKEGWARVAAPILLWV